MWARESLEHIIFRYILLNRPTQTSNIWPPPSRERERGISEDGKMYPSAASLLRFVQHHQFLLTELIASEHCHFYQKKIFSFFDVGLYYLNSSRTQTCALLMTLFKKKWWLRRMSRKFHGNNEIILVFCSILSCHFTSIITTPPPL